ncbi:hypothetical protein GGI02_004220 [Coemansia sp. RSA 2322]|nr:hypothetical protein GGI02_004220 [Coemansia sp. RSA 2322]
MLYVHTSILTDAPSIVLRGAASEAPGQVLSGRVVVRLCYSLKVVQVTIALRSTCNHRGLLRQNPSAIYDNTAIEQLLFDASDSPLGYAVWGPGTPSSPLRELPFSIALPGNLHESVQTEFGNISYEIKATIRSCGFGINTWAQSLHIPVLRVPGESLLPTPALTEPLCARADWLGAVELQMLGDSATVSDKSKLCVRAIICPLQKGLALVDVGLRLSEHTRCKSIMGRFGDPLTSKNVLCRNQIKTHDEYLHALPLQYEHCFNLMLDVPEAHRHVQYDMDTTRVRVAHELELTATVLDDSQDVHYLRLAAPIQIVPRVALETTYAELPAYSSSGCDRLLLESSRSSTITEIADESSQQSDIALLLPPPSYQDLFSSLRPLAA